MNTKMAESSQNTLDDFRRSVSPLMTSMGVELLPDDCNMYHLRVADELDVCLHGAEPGFLVMMTFLPITFEIDDAEAMFGMLASNQVGEAHPTLVCSTTRKRRPIVWTRQALEEVAGNGGQELLERVIRRAGELMRFLEGCGRAADATLLGVGLDLC